jgi:hypothetical protein
VKERYKEGSANDRPDDWKRRAADVKGERLGEPELPGQQRAEDGADEAKGDRNEKTSWRAAGERLANRAANGRDNEKHEKPRQCDRHARTSCMSHADNLPQILPLG